MKMLTQEEAFKIAGALARLDEIKNTAPTNIVVPGKVKPEDEVNQLVDFLAQELISHGQELMGCFFAVRTEYEPLVRALAPAFKRVHAGLNRPQPETETKDESKQS